MTLVHGSAAVPDPSSVGDDRVVYAFLGESGHFREASGLSYDLAHVADAAGDLSFTWAGQSISACGATPAAPCFTASADGAEVNVTGPGALTVSAAGKPAATLNVGGGSPARKLRIIVRR
jgi:hypothetical protein